MLNKGERYKVLKVLRICCNLGLLPFQVDLENWQLQAPSIGKRWACMASYCCFVLHVLYKSGSLVYTYFFVPDVQLHQMIIHIILMLASIMAAFWYYVLCIRYPALFATFVKMALLGDVEGAGTDLDQSDELKMHWRTRLGEYSLQDLMAICSPYMLVVCIVFVVAAYIYDPSMRLLVYAAIPIYLQSWATFGLCVLEEIRLLAIISAAVVPMLIIQVISFDLLCHQLRLSMSKLQNGTQSCRSVFRFLRCLQLYISTFNNINRYLIFTWKLVSITMSITSGYAAIAHFRDHPVFGIMYYMILAEGALFYAVIYEKAFMVPQLLDRTIGYALLRMDGNRAGLFGKQMRSIPPTGVKVGNFHRMERASTLIYMNFVVVNIVNMLVAYG